MINLLIASTLTLAGLIAMCVAAYLYWVALRRAKRGYEPMEFSEVRKTVIYSDHINKGEL